MTQKYYAHSKEGCPPDEWQQLEGHMKNVAELARGFDNAFGAGEWASLIHPFNGFSRTSPNTDLGIQGIR
jgi:CRISPR-associated endonuclease/helicase Cas3